MGQVERILQRRGQVDATELERVRARTIERLSSIREQPGAQDGGPERTEALSPDMPTGRPPVPVMAPTALPATDGHDADGEIEAVAGRPARVDPEPVDPEPVDPEPIEVIPLAAPASSATASVPDPAAGQAAASAPAHASIASRSHAAAMRPPIIVAVSARSAGDGPATATTPTLTVVATAESAPMEPEPVRPELPEPAPIPTAARAVGAPRKSPGTRRSASPRVLTAAHCPYCALPLEPPPTSDQRCGRCRQRIVVRTVDDGRLVYFTEAAVVVFEAEQARAANEARWERERADWLDLARVSGAPAARIARASRTAISEHAVTAARDVYLAAVDDAVGSALREDLWEVASSLRRDAADEVRRRESPDGRPSSAVIDWSRDAARIELRGLATMARSAVIVGGRCCDACRADDGAVVRIAGELRATRLPHEGCAKPPCRCRWDMAPRDVAMVQRYLERRPG